MQLQSELTQYMKTTPFRQRSRARFSVPQRIPALIVSPLVQQRVHNNNSGFYIMIAIFLQDATEFAWKDIHRHPYRGLENQGIRHGCQE